MVDIDWFKAYNDYRGHVKGDALLRKIAGIFSAAIRLCDKLYRYGGEEFALLLPETNKEGALLAAKRLHRIILEQAFDGADASQPEGKVTISIGVASCPEDGNTKQSLLKAADDALYRAKQEGRNRIVV